jgi:hypothetical protein
MSFYLIPTTTQEINNQEIIAPEYLTTDLANLSFGSIPCGVEPIALVALAAPNSALAAESDVFAFPSNLSTTLAASDVTTLVAFLSNLNIPNSFLAAGATFQSVVRQIAQIFLAVQYAEGPAGTNGASVFVQLISPTPSATLQSIPAGAFDFTGVEPTDSVADSIIVVSQQFDGPIAVGNGGVL